MGAERAASLRGRVFAGYENDPLALAIKDLNIRSEKKAKGFGANMMALIRAKNYFKHDRGPTVLKDIATASGEVQERLRRCMEALAFSTAYPIRQVEDFDVARRGGVILKCLRYTGDHPSFPQEEIPFHRALPRRPVLGPGPEWLGYAGGDNISLTQEREGQEVLALCDGDYLRRYKPDLDPKTRCYRLLIITWCVNIDAAMIKSFADKETRKVWDSERSKAVPADLQRKALQKLEQIDVVDDLNELRVPPGNKLEKLGRRPRGAAFGQDQPPVQGVFRLGRRRCSRGRNSRLPLGER